MTKSTTALLGILTAFALSSTACTAPSDDPAVVTTVKKCQQTDRASKEAFCRTTFAKI